jgi:hypothetical protein
MSKDRLFFIRYFNATFLWVCPSTEIISRFVSIVNTRFTNPNRFVSRDLMILNVKLRVLFRQLIVHHCDKIEWRPTPTSRDFLLSANLLYYVLFNSMLYSPAWP